MGTRQEIRKAIKELASRYTRKQLRIALNQGELRANSPLFLYAARISAVAAATAAAAIWYYFWDDLDGESEPDKGSGEERDGEDEDSGENGDTGTGYRDPGDGSCPPLTLC